MAALGRRLMPFHPLHTASPPPAMIPICISLVGKAARSRFVCNHSIDMSNYRHKFAHRMAMAGLKPHHRIAMAVSGGPDSIALCVLTAGWKTDSFDTAKKERNTTIDGLLAIIVDHGLRTESVEEANLVRNRILDMGIKCEVAQCEWLDGRPKLGHLQEAARNKRYETLQNICLQHQISILLAAHHADDQAELFILRLSRNSGVLGLAGMAFTSQMFSEFPDFNGEGSKTRGVLLARPLLEFSKVDMYDICCGGNQQWVEDPTNRSPLYARNRIRMSLTNSSSTFKAELQAVISACRSTRMHVDKFCHLLLNQAVTIMPHGYAVIDLEILHSIEVKNIYLAKFIASVLQFISQKHRPIRGNALKLLLNYLQTFPCKTCLTVAGCYLCPAPGSKGTKVLVCCFVDSSMPLMMKLVHAYSHGVQNCVATNELEQILTDSKAYMSRFITDDRSVPFLDVTSPESILIEAERLGILSRSSYKSIVSLQKEESENFLSKTEATSEFVSKDNIRSSDTTRSKLIYPGQVVYFMNRFLLDWKVCDTVPYNASPKYEFVPVKDLGAESQCFCSCCVVGDEMVAEVRHMADADWIYLSDLLKRTNLGDSQPGNHPDAREEQLIVGNMDYAILSASRALVALKSIPVAARRSIPVLVSAKGVLLSIPSIGFAHCPHLMVFTVFTPRIPLGGGHSSFL